MTGDVGSRGVTATEQDREDLPSLIQSNFSRASESARVFEEFSKLSNPSLAQEWKNIRFEIYSLEKQLLAAVAGASVKYRLANMDLYCVVDKALTGNQSPFNIVREMLLGGANIIQYRDKISCDGEFLKTSRRIQKLCADSDAMFIVNDRVDIAHLSDADGVHLGRNDMPVAETRRILGPGKIIGISCYTLTDVRTALREAVDYIAVGSIFPTGTKEKVRIVGPEFISKTRAAAGNIPIVAIGGINRRNIAGVLLHRPNGICIISAIQTSANISAAVKGFVRLIRKSRQ